MNVPIFSIQRGDLLQDVTVDPAIQSHLQMKHEWGVCYIDKPHQFKYRNDTHGFNLPLCGLSSFAVEKGKVTSMRIHPQLTLLNQAQALSQLSEIMSIIRTAGWRWDDSFKRYTRLEDLPVFFDDPYHRIFTVGIWHLGKDKIILNIQLEWLADELNEHLNLIQKANSRHLSDGYLIDFSVVENNKMVSP